MTAGRGGIAFGLIFAFLALANLAIAIAPFSFSGLRWDYVVEWCALIAVAGVLTALVVRIWLGQLERSTWPND
jgi:hypothetical protein